MEIPEKYRGKMYIIIATDFTQHIDVGHATVFGNKPSYVYRVFFYLEELRENIGKWINCIEHLGGSAQSIVSFDKVNSEFGNLISQAVTELNRGELDISQLEKYTSEQK